MTLASYVDNYVESVDYSKKYKKNESIVSFKNEENARKFERKI